MPLATIIAGRYSATWNALACGLCKDDGFRLIESPKEQQINRTDAYAQTLVETVYQGVDWSAVFTLIEWGAAAIPTIMSPWGTFGTIGTIATLGSAHAKPLVLTSTAGTPAATAPATLTAMLAKLSQQANVEINFTSAGREVPIRLDLLPDEHSSVKKHFHTT